MTERYAVLKALLLLGELIASLVALMTACSAPSMPYFLVGALIKCNIVPTSQLHSHPLLRQEDLRCGYGTFCKPLLLLQLDAKQNEESQLCYKRAFGCMFVPHAPGLHGGMFK